MEVQPIAGVSVIELPDGTVALVMVEIMSAAVAAKIAKALIEFPQPPTVLRPKRPRKPK